MESRLEQAKNALRGEITFAAVLQDGQLIVSQKKGIAPMMEILENNCEMLKNACVADRVIGKAAALLMEKAGAAAVFGEVVSTYARNVFRENTIFFQYQTEVEYIINRTNTGMCPMEQAVLAIEDTQEAYRVLRKKLQEMTKGETI